MKKPASGFSLIELLVSFTVILLLVGGGIAAYQKFNEKEFVHQAALNLRSDLRDAQKMAMAGVKPVGCDSLLGYQVSFENNSQYKIDAVCQTGTSINVRGVTLKNNVTKNGSEDFDVTFKILSLGVAFDNGNNMVSLGMNESYREVVEVTLGGEVKVYVQE